LKTMPLFFMQKHRTSRQDFGNLRILLKSRHTNYGANNALYISKTLPLHSNTQ